MVYFERLYGAAVALAAPLARIEAWLREWTIATMSLLLLALLLAGTTLLGR